MKEHTKLFGHSFYHQSIRKYVTLFGTLFNDLYIIRTDSNNDKITIKVPIAYGPREKTLARLTADPLIDRKPAIVLPRMSFQIENIRYAADRKLKTIHRNVSSSNTDPDQLNYQYNPVPYDIDFSLSIMVRHTDDGTRIVEQILPFFTPEWTATVQMIPDINYTIDIPTVLTSVRLEDQYEDNFEERRVLIWELQFTMKGYIFGPVRKAGIIKFANTTFINSVSNNDLSEVQVKPGLDANGNPTSNTSVTVGADLINSDDDYGFVVTIT